MGSATNLLSGDHNWRAPRRSMRRKHLRLEGLVVHKRIGKGEKTRYLVLDLLSGSISMYRSPPPCDENESYKRPRSNASKLFASANNIRKSFSNKPSFRSERSVASESGEEDEKARKELAHICKEPNNYSKGSWDPLWTVPGSVDWAIRDVENDEVSFLLSLPPDFEAKDNDADVFTLTREKGFISCRALGNSDKTQSFYIRNSGTYNEEADDDDATRASSIFSGDAEAPSIKNIEDRSSTLSASMIKKLKKMGTEKRQILYQLRVLLDGNEKFIWLQAAAEMNRLASDSASCLVCAKIEAARRFFTISTNRAKAKATALRYAEWARLIDERKSVSGVDFDVRNIQLQERDVEEESSQYDSKKLVKVMPLYAYRNRKMTEKDLNIQMMYESERWEDFRQVRSGDREESMIGSLHVEVLSCHGLPKLDRLSKTDAVCYFVCGPFAFATDVIDGALSPIWPCKSRRACIFPIFYAYTKLYVGVFDDDGPRGNDDFAGRVVVDITRLRPNSEYDVFLPLRLYQNTYIKESRGVVHLRLRLEWENEQKALLSYLKLPEKTPLLDNAVTVNCADLKGFRNVVLTVQGKDVPGRYKQVVMRGLQREMKLYKMVTKTAVKEKLMDVVFWVHPLTSMCIFVAWMHCVYSNSMSYVPVYIVACVIALLLRNYAKYGACEAFHASFTPVGVSELLLCLFFGGPETNYLKPVEKKGPNCADFKKKKSTSFYGDDFMCCGESVRNCPPVLMDGDHMEFPFSEKGRYAKMTLAEACTDASKVFLDEDDEDENSTISFSYLKRKKKKRKLNLNFYKLNNDSDEEEDEFGIAPLSNPLLPDLSSKKDISTAVKARARNTRSIQQNFDVEPGNMPTCSATYNNISSYLSVEDDKIWKKTKEALPEQDASVLVKNRKTLKENIVGMKDNMHKASMRLFDDRMFITNSKTGHSVNEELTLNAAIGTHKHNNPVVAKMEEYMAPMLEMLKIALSAWRSLFNLFTWRDTYSSFWLLFGCVFLLCALLVFPWRLFFFVMGFGVVGPQNWLFRIVREFQKLRAASIVREDDQTNKNMNKLTFQGKTNSQAKRNAEFSRNFRFYNHLVTQNGSNPREEESTPKGSLYRAVVPNSPLISRRFYDWPPNPSLSKAQAHIKLS